MGIRVYNTLTRRKEDLVTRDPGKTSIYVCGVTPYSDTHIGHLVPAIFWDVIRKYLKYRGYQVYFIQNFTDVDDKIIARANKEERNAAEIAERYIADYLTVLEMMGLEPADRYVKVTQEMEQIIRVIEGLVQKGYAYQAGGDVFYAVDKFPGYGKLSGRTPEELEAGARVEISPLKRNPMDFALWKAAKPGEPAWDSPWGKGRPGWHIECSAMSLKYLGSGFDMHGGGLDLIFPHHENEIAQSEAYTGEPFARYWVHTGLVTVGGEKMSKSLGNTLAARELIQQWGPEVVKFFLLTNHYRSTFNFSAEELENASRGLARLVRVVEAVQALVDRTAATGEATGGRVPELDDALAEVEEKFRSAMDDDFNTALAIASLHDFAREINRVINAPSFRLTQETQSQLRKVLKVFDELAGKAGILGILPQRAQAGGAGSQDGALLEGLMELILDIRHSAKQARDWGIADRIRDTLKKLGITVEDTPQGPRWRRS